MKLLKTQDIVKALTKKGFTIERGHKHVHFFLIIDGKQTGISTMLSHGGGEPRQQLLHQIKNQICFNDTCDFERYIDCDMSFDEYKVYLTRIGKI
ncbi:MAG: hypothetical protein M1331_00855 [Candidatus Marsarchaeota archaeon]|nr:hypothetical protein [Candidatus Marsarchaeota archaeon]